MTAIKRSNLKPVEEIGEFPIVNFLIEFLA